MKIPTITGTFTRPAIATIGDQCYVVPGYIPVDDSVTVQQVLEKWVPWKPEDSDDFGYRNGMHTVPSSDGKRKYTVRFNGDHWSCGCVGFGFRGRCKHIEKAKVIQKMKRIASEQPRSG